MTGVATSPADASGPLRDALRGARRRAMFLTMRWLVRRVGFEGLRPLGRLLGAVHYGLGAGTRRRCQAGLAAWLGRDLADPTVAELLREAYRVNTIAVLEVLSMIDRPLAATRLTALCEVQGIETLQAARCGRGAILLASHAGNGLLVAAQLAAAGLPVSIVYRHTRMMSKAFFESGLPRYGLEPILANEGFRAYARMLDALRRNRVLFAMIDQGVEKAETGLPLRFLGKDMPMPGGVVQLARHARAPLLTLTTLAAAPRWQFRIGPRLMLPPGGSISEDTAVVLAHLEQQIRARPQLWSWPHRRWRNYPVTA